jgi:hypothetical protein
MKWRLIAGNSDLTDMSAAAHADLLFVKEMANGDSDLASYCKFDPPDGRYFSCRLISVSVIGKEQNISHVSFRDL